VSTTTLIARVTIDDDLKDFVPLEELAEFVDRFGGEKEYESARLRKLTRPINNEALASCFAVLELRCANGLRFEAFYVYGNGDCAIKGDTPHLRYLFPVSADEVRENLRFLD
jgi:hypothetical protein